MIVGLFALAGRLNADEADVLPDESIQSALEQLDLREDQKEPVRAILKESAAQRRAILQKEGIELGSGEKPSFRQLRKAAPQLRKVVKEQDEKLSGVLDPEQMKAFRELRDELRKNAKQKLKDRRASGE